MAKFKVGDKVLVARRGRNFNFEGLMDKYIGGVYVVRDVCGQIDPLYELEDDQGNLLGYNDADAWGFLEDSLAVPGPYAMHHMIAREICGEFNHGKV